jgi:hypothetical protein
VRTWSKSGTLDAAGLAIIPFINSSKKRCGLVNFTQTPGQNSSIVCEQFGWIVASSPTSSLSFQLLSVVLNVFF